MGAGTRQEDSWLGEDRRGRGEEERVQVGKPRKIGTIACKMWRGVRGLVGGDVCGGMHRRRGHGRVGREREWVEEGKRKEGRSWSSTGREGKWGRERRQEGTEVQGEEWGAGQTMQVGGMHAPNE